MAGNGEPEQISGMLVSHNAFAMLNVKPLLGRAFLPEDDQPGAEARIILSHGLWQRRFGADAAIIGKTISLNGEIRAVIGVMPASFQFPILSTAERWRPLRQRGCITIRVLARLKEGVSETQARTELKTIAANIEQQFPETNTKVGATLIPLQDFIVGPVRTPMLLLLVAVAFVLLIACVNVANLLLARATTREKEMAVRASLGAGCWRIIRQLLAEGVLLASIGGAVARVRHCRRGKGKTRSRLSHVGATIADLLRAIAEAGTAENIAAQIGAYSRTLRQTLRD